VARRVPYAFARSRGVVVTRVKDGRAEVWMRSGAEPGALTELSRVLEADLVVAPLSDEAFNMLLKRIYETGFKEAQSVAAEADTDASDARQIAAALLGADELLAAGTGAPVERLLNALLSQALRDGASDVHIEPFETRVAVRFRLDGLLREVLTLNKDSHPVVVSRVKVMANLDTAEKSAPRDGRFSVRLGGRPVDVRVSTLLTGHGERVVMRLWDKDAAHMTLPALGLSTEVLDRTRRLLQRPHGIFLVTGPTGSGKTTTLYAALAELDRARKNIMTVEDPIEYALDGVGQTQVDLKTDLTFARALRAILRQDPDAIMIGEIRDAETAAIAAQASLTGHLVLAALHTNDAVGAVARLSDMGLERFLLASSLLGVMAQRLVRKLCPSCRRPQRVAPADAERWGLRPNAPVFTASGCALCNETGYRNRTGVYQLLEVNESLRSLIHGGAPEDAIRAHAGGLGLQTLRQDGARWVDGGVTSLEELARVTSE
jgi:general secretion pathway protein E